MRKARPAPDDEQTRLHEVVEELTDEFGPRFAAEVVREVVHDSYLSLVRHVPRTAWSYVRPWARQRLLARGGPTGREPSLAEMLSTPAQHL